MSKEEKSVLATACSVQNFGAGDTILREGEVGEWMFLDFRSNSLVKAKACVVWHILVVNGFEKQRRLGRFRRSNRIQQHLRFIVIEGTVKTVDQQLGCIKAAM